MSDVTPEDIAEHEEYERVVLALRDFTAERLSPLLVDLVLLVEHNEQARS